MIGHFEVAHKMHTQKKNTEKHTIWTHKKALFDYSMLKLTLVYEMFNQVEAV